jgi:hypothetical protein
MMDVLSEDCLVVCVWLNVRWDGMSVFGLNLVLIEAGLTAFDLEPLRDRVCDLVVPDKSDDLLVSRLNSKSQKIVPR